MLKSLSSYCLADTNHGRFPKPASSVWPVLNKLKGRINLELPFNTVPFIEKTSSKFTSPRSLSLQYDNLNKWTWICLARWASVHLLVKYTCLQRCLLISYCQILFIVPASFAILFAFSTDASCFLLFKQCHSNFSRSLNLLSLNLPF